MSGRNFFHRIAPVYDRFHLGARRSAHRVVTFGSLRKTDEVLDLGGGTGRVAQHIRSRVRAVTVADPSESMISECQKKPGLACVKTLAEKLPFAADTFDVVMMVDAFHHFRDHAQVVRETARVLRRGGKIVMEEFHPKRAWGKAIAAMERILKLGSTFFPPDELAAVWRRKGFAVTLRREKKSTYFLVGMKKN